MQVIGPDPSAGIVRLRRVRLGFDDEGEGAPLVLLHGLATTRIIWRRVVPLLTAERRVIAVDVPGFGASPAAGPGFELTVVADRIADGLAGAGVPAPYHLVGHSMGGAVALTLADRHRDRVRSLVLAAPAGLRAFPAPVAGALGAASEGLVRLRRVGAPIADRGWGRRVLLAGGVVDPLAIPPAEVKLMMAASRGATRIRPALATVAAADLLPVVERLPAPLGLVWGDRDRVVPVSGADAVLRVRPDTPVERIPRAGHIAMMERPDDFAKALQTALRCAVVNA
jgi:pimeloyl-ACP methyl ester carboxylesterase